ncbi:CopG family transcriptional regulator [Moorena producens]|uniref:ribbon-helix-helix domain-containing protein n=1 Tax=Moorena producens TaxID=1155739 RepID=UPI003C767C72
MKNKKLTIRVTDFERRQLEQEANRRGMTQSELIRSLIARFPVRVASALPNPKDPVRDSSHTHGVALRCGASRGFKLKKISLRVRYSSTHSNCNSCSNKPSNLSWSMGFARKPSQPSI